MGPTSGLTISFGDSGTSTWNTIVTGDYGYATGDSPTASVTFDSLADTVWPIWRDETRSAANFTTRITEPTMTGDRIWFNWVTNGYPTSHESATAIRLRDFAWTEWIDANGSRVRVQPAPLVQAHNYAPPARPSKIVEIRARRKRRKARKRGKELLQSICSLEQWRDYCLYGAVREIGERAIYEVGAGWSGHVYELGFDGQPKRKLCLGMGTGHTGHPWVAEDRIAAILMSFRADEAGTVAKAGVHRWADHERERVKARRGHKRRVA